jgi:hypothetical protein
LKQKQYRIRKNSPWLKYISIYNDKKKEKVNSFKCHVWSAYTYTTTEGKNIHTKHYIIYRNVCTSVMKPFPAKKQPATTISPPQKISQNLTQNAIFLESRLLFCIHRVTRTKKTLAENSKNIILKWFEPSNHTVVAFEKIKSELKQKLVNCKEIKSMSNTGKGSDDKNSVFQNFQSGKMRSRWKKTNAMNVLTIK